MHCTISARRRPSCLGLYLLTVTLVCYKNIIQVYLDTFNQFKAHAVCHNKLTANCYLLRTQTTTGCQYEKPFFLWWPPTEYTMCTDSQRVCPFACMMYIASYFRTNLLYGSFLILSIVLSLSYGLPPPFFELHNTRSNTKTQSTCLDCQYNKVLSCNVIQSTTRRVRPYAASINWNSACTVIYESGSIVDIISLSTETVALPEISREYWCRCVYFE